MPFYSQCPLIDFTLSNARWIYSSMGAPWGLNLLTPQTPRDTPRGWVKSVKSHFQGTMGQWIKGFFGGVGWDEAVCVRKGDLWHFIMIRNLKREVSIKLEVGGSWFECSDQLYQQGVWWPISLGESDGMPFLKECCQRPHFKSKIDDYWYMYVLTTSCCHCQNGFKLRFERICLNFFCQFWGKSMWLLWVK